MIQQKDQNVGHIQQISELETNAELLYLKSLELAHKETQLASSARKSWARFATSSTGIITFFIAGIFRDRLFHQPRKFASAKTNRWLKISIAQWVQSLFY